MTWEAVKKRQCQVLSPVGTKQHAATQIHSRLQSANETLQQHIQEFIDLVIHSSGTDSTSVTCQVIIILLIWYLFNKEVKKNQVPGTKSIQILRYAMTLAQEVDIKLKKVQGSLWWYTNSNTNYHSSTVRSVSCIRAKWSAPETHKVVIRYGMWSYMLQMWRKGHLAWECPHTGSSVVAQRQQTPIFNANQTSCAVLVQPHSSHKPHSVINHNCWNSNYCRGMVDPNGTIEQGKSR